MQLFTTTTQDIHRLLGIYIHYRLCLGLLLGFSHWAGFTDGVFGHTHPHLFTNTLLIYILLCSASVILYRIKTLKTDSAYLLSLLVFDFIMLVLMIYASGGLSSGLGYLLLIPMAIGSTCIRGQAHIALAAFTSLLVLGISLISIKTGVAGTRSIVSAGITGSLLFITAISFRRFAEKLLTSENAAKKQTEQAHYLQLISQRIVENMRTGIIVVDNHLGIKLINHSATILLTSDDTFHDLASIEPIHSRLTQWQHDGITPSSVTYTRTDNRTITINFTPLQDLRFPSVMLFLEDRQRLNQQAQQLKLASLGRLTASIAHEIRNPLGAISHASQLLEESEHIQPQDQDLLTIIHNHSRRIDEIINNILDFSRRKGANPILISVNTWLDDFKREYQQHHSGQIALTFDDENIQAKIDPNHLYQIMNNLADNGMRYSLKNTGEERIHIHSGLDAKEDCAYIELIDFGEGIPPDKTTDVFEPFYTTEVTGSGLGLYLCKELSEANQANLNYRYDEDKQQSIFSILLSHPQRSIALQ